MLFKAFYGIALVVVIASCHQQNSELPRGESESSFVTDADTTIGLTTTPTEYDSLDFWQQKVLIKGDQVAYNKLRVVSLDMPQSCFLFYALTMANKHDYAAAYTDVYLVLIDANSCDYHSPECLDAQSRKLALEYLNIGAMKGDTNATSILTEISNSKSSQGEP